ncbi:hypothetical protein CDD82_977 [Ophiocordyceps australis]|uniref:Uncharacterized protein n=1 Tax=Ophiocordyceps australis TaxID=1399860 RepID=A0A2C5YJR5_9HYPO|nr:hypothetical protein CDD82_977 [Ophiocordyceps australis]
MWDAHFRVGGAQGSDLTISDCPLHSPNTQRCMAAALLLHITGDASAYLDNVWLWIADHDLDDERNSLSYESLEGIPLNVQTQISVYVGRGVLMESRGPSWLYGSSSEHAQLYQYQLVGAENVFLGHMQTESPYYQPKPNALGPYKPGGFVSDPTFADCVHDGCRGAWALRVVNSSNVFVYSAGFYSFFQDNELGCTKDETCQLAMVETSYASGLWIFNLFTKGNEQIMTPRGGLEPLLFSDETRNGYTSEIAAWLVLSTGGEQVGDDGNGSGHVLIDPHLWRQPQEALSVACVPPCTYVFPPVTLPTDTVFVYPPLTTELEVGWFDQTSYTYLGKVTPTRTYVKVTVTTVITINPVTTSVVSLFNVVVRDNHTTIFPEASIVAPPLIITDDTTT